MDLKDSSKLMLSESYKERFIAEYLQVSCRLKKLENFCHKYEKGDLDFKPNCPLTLLQNQVDVMKKYKAILETRAKVYENINLPGNPISL